MDALTHGLLKLDPGLLLWTIITFIVMVLILWKTAWKPIVEALDSRAEKLRGDIENAEKAHVEANQVLNKHKELIANAKAETAKIIADGRATAEKARNGILEKANEEAREIVERSKREIAIASDKALSELKLEIANFATDIASKVIAKSIKPEDHKKIINDALGKLENIQ